MYYRNSRYYNPEIGRFISSDGMLGEVGDVLSTNMYAYTENNPVMNYDPSGYMSDENNAVNENEPTLARAEGEGFSEPVEEVSSDANVKPSEVANNDIVKGATNTIKTPYGKAVQDMSEKALSVREYVEQGGELYRGGALGRSKIVDGQFWATESPLSPGYAEKYGVDFKQLDFIIKGRLTQGTEFVTRPAPALGVNSGGALEIVTPPGCVTIDYFYMIGGSK